MPLHKISTTRRSRHRRRLRDPSVGSARGEIPPAGTHLVRAGNYTRGTRRAAAGRQLAAEPGDVLHHLGRAGSAPADGRVASTRT